MYAVVVKWGVKKFEDVELHLDEPLALFKAIIYTLTGVEPVRQKFFLNGKILKGEYLPKDLKISEGQIIMLMGSTEATIKEPSQVATHKDLFLSNDDLSLRQEASSSIDRNSPVGLTNLGNTCYFSAVLQCIRSIPELRTSITSVKHKSFFETNKLHNTTTHIGMLFKSMDTTKEPNLSPVMSHRTFMEAFPQYAEENRDGYLQQDAEECWGHLMQAFQDIVPGYNSDGTLDNNTSFISQFMTGTLKNEIECLDAPDEKHEIDETVFNEISINIGHGSHTYMTSDMTDNFNHNISKMSPTLNKSAQYKRTSKFLRLPEYLVINFVRFQWKNTEKLKAKILKKVEFPFNLDLFALCAPELQEKISPVREQIIKVDTDSERIERLAKIRKYEDDDRKSDRALRYTPENLISSSGSHSTSKKEEDLPLKEKIRLLFAQRKKALKDIGVLDEVINDIGANHSGMYELIAVLTHAGRSADSGHYVAWTKYGNCWYKIDDKNVSVVTKDQIQRLSGGGDWHSAYICIYKSREVPPNLSGA